MKAVFDEHYKYATSLSSVLFCSVLFWLTRLDYYHYLSLPINFITFSPSLSLILLSFSNSLSHSPLSFSLCIFRSVFDRALHLQRAVHRSRFDSRRQLATFNIRCCYHADHQMDQRRIWNVSNSLPDHPGLLSRCYVVIPSRNQDQSYDF